MAAHAWAVNIRPFLSSHTARPGYKASSLVNQPTFLLLIYVAWKQSYLEYVSTLFQNLRSVFLL